MFKLCERAKINGNISVLLKEKIEYSDELWIMAQRIMDEIKYRIDIQKNQQHREHFYGAFGEMPIASDKSN